MIVRVDRALSLNPSFARGWHASGCLRLWGGQLDVVIEHVRASLRLSARTRVGWGLNAIAAAHMTCHGFEGAVSVVLVLIEEYPSPIAYQGAGCVLRAFGGWQRHARLRGVSGWFRL